MQLPHTIDERRVMVPIGLLVFQAQHAEGRDRLAFALELERRHRLRLDRRTYKPIGAHA